MITCDIQGPNNVNSGLGNQMFCIATALNLAFLNNDEATFPQLHEPLFEYYGKTVFHKLRKDYLEPTHFHFEKPRTSTKYKKIKYKDGLCIKGYFQSYKYFEKSRDKVLESFQMPDEMRLAIEDKHKDLIENAGNMVSFHVRRGDYLKIPDYYTILDRDYYEKALEMQDKDIIVFFSDDIEWCKSELKFPGKEMLFVEGEKDLTDMYLMSKMAVNVLANSTFSWWAAYLNDRKDKKVIAPMNWFGPDRVKSNKKETKDLIPPDWIRI